MRRNDVSQENTGCESVEWISRPVCWDFTIKPRKGRRLLEFIGRISVEVVDNEAVLREKNCLCVQANRPADEEKRLRRCPTPARRRPRVRTMNGAAETACRRGLDRVPGVPAFDQAAAMGAWPEGTGNPHPPDPRSRWGAWRTLCSVCSR